VFCHRVNVEPLKIVNILLVFPMKIVGFPVDATRAQDGPHRAGPADSASRLIQATLDLIPGG
jgi:hypothetical protein